MSLDSWPASLSARVSARPMTRWPPSVFGGLDVTTATRTRLPGGYDSCRNADGDGMVGDVVLHHSTRADNRVGTDGDAVEDLGACANPGAVADVHARGHARL